MKYRWAVNITANLQEVGGGELLERNHLAQDRVQWRATVNAVMILRVPYMLGIS
jgi:hypothetical protein